MSVEKTTRYATIRPDLTSAFAFVMAHVDDVGDAPSIHIQPVWMVTDEAPAGVRHFEVAVSGMSEVAEESEPAET